MNPTQYAAIKAIGDPGKARVMMFTNGQAAHASVNAVAAGAIHGATAKATPVDADEFGYYDSVGAGPVKATWANFKATLKTYLDTLYQPLSAVLTALSGIGTAVAGDLIYGSGAGTWARLAKGTALQNLRINAAGTAPEWATAREVLTANRTYFVSTTGNDSNNGLSAGAPFLTIQKAVNTALALDMSIYSVTISIGAGTFAEGSFLNIAGNGNARITLLGAGYTSTIISGTTYGIFLLGGVSLTLSGLNVTGVSVGLWVRYAAQCFVSGNVAFGGGSARLIGTDNAGYFECTGTGNNIYLAADSAYAFFANGLGHIFIGNSAKVLTTAARTFTATVNAASAGSLIDLPSLTFDVTAGAVTGSRYTATLNGVINTSGGGASYIPGSTVGTTATGGQYA